MTDKQGFKLQSIESHAELNRKNINKLESKKAMLNPVADKETIERIDAHILRSDVTSALKKLSDLETHIYKLKDAINDGLSFVSEKIFANKTN